MAVIPKDAFKTPVIGVDPVTKGTFTITWANILLDEAIKNTRATGNVIIEGTNNNPLFQAIKANPLRAQGLLGSVMFGTEKFLIKFANVEHFDIEDDGIFGEIEFTLTFDILDNLEYLEHITEYQREHSL
jgi:hypothetical protein